MGRFDTFDALAAQIGEPGPKRWARFNPATWAHFSAYPGRELYKGLVAAGDSDEQALATCKSFLDLGFEAVGQGHYTHAHVYTSLFHLAFNRWLPEGLPKVPPSQRPGRLAAVWNFAENLQDQPSWLTFVFTRVLADWSDLAGLEAEVQRIGAGLFGDPAKALGGIVRHDWVWLGSAPGESFASRFLPGALYFLAPTVLVVVDRVRQMPGGGPIAQALWLPDDGPVVPLGPIPVEKAAPVEWDERSLPLWDALGRTDPRMTFLCATAANRFRAAATLETSQFVVVARPER